MGDLVKLNCLTKLPIAPDDVLSGAVGKLDYVLLIGINKDGNPYFASSEGDMHKAVYWATKLIHKQHNGDFF